MSVAAADPRIRTATDEDWLRIWPFFDVTVQEGETYAFPLDLTVETGRGWWMERPPGETVVLEDTLPGAGPAAGPEAGPGAGPGAGATVLGSAKMGPNRPGHGDHVGTASFMVAPEARGRGVGRALGEHVVAWHRERGFRGIQFNAVVETNTAAVALWLSLGFEVVGTVPGAFRSPAHGYVGLHVMHLSLV